ncbi:MAG: 50S ribosomal protein L9 [Deltaproteobacteria bacterium]|nr:50S ribosomal protein L9 [Deltaproteobacteria bacterium]
MRVILLEDIEGLGTIGEEVKVKDGYARNFLIPKGKAIKATVANAKTLKDRYRTQTKKEVKTREEAHALAEILSSTTLSFDVKVGQEGKLFGSITGSNIYEALKEKGVEIDKKKIVMAEPIRHTGSHEIAIKLYPNIVATIKVEVSAEA